MGGFFSQPNKDYRNMQLVFTYLTVNFIFPSLGYYFLPEFAYGEFLRIGDLLGAGPYPLPDENSYLWRTLGAGNVLTLATLCFWMQRDIRKWPHLAPVFYVLKSSSAVGFLYVYVFKLHYLTFLAVFFYDGLAVVLVWYFGGKAWRSLANSETATLVPKLP